jgi:hypothetical protein
VGQFHPLNTNNVLLQGATTYRWTAWDGHFEDLGTVPVAIGGARETQISQAYAVSDDGSVVGGDSGGVNDKGAMIWTYETGMMCGTDYLTLKGVTDHLSWLKLTKTVYISPDGRVVAGYGFVRGNGPGTPDVPKDLDRDAAVRVRLIFFLRLNPMMPRGRKPERQIESFASQL